MQLSSIGTNIISIANSTGAVVKKGASKGAAKAGFIGQKAIHQIKSIAIWTGSSISKVAHVGLRAIQQLSQNAISFIKNPKNLKITAVAVALFTTTVIIAKKILKKRETPPADDFRLDLHGDLDRADPVADVGGIARMDSHAEEEVPAAVPVNRADSAADDLFASALDA